MIPEKAIELIKRFEGFSPVPYLCPAGWLTIGYGHVIREGERWDEPITEEMAERLLLIDLQRYSRAIQRLILVPLNENQFGALLSFTYNLGSGALQRSSLRQKLNRGEYLEAADEFPKWCWAGGRKLRGLLRRRLAERELFLEEGLP